ncbi:hypothetical protein vseg_006100 [Gypsophila vaccaria]
MKLEDFFTSTAMKVGLASPARVQELIAGMKEKNCVVKNVGDSTRLWVAVASTIAATESKECLDLFLQLDGLCFINRWLKDAQTFANEESACFLEEAISALLQVVEKLQIDDERLVSSGICVTVQGLLSYTSLKVQDKARSLLNSWKIKNVDIESMDVENAAAYDDADSTSECSKSDFNAIHVDQKSNGTEKENVKLTNDRKCSHVTSGHADIKDKHPESVASPVKLDSVIKHPSVKEKILCSLDGNSNAQILAAPKQSANVVVSVKRELGTLPVDVNKGKGKASSFWGESDGRIPLSGTHFTAVVTRPDVSTYDRREGVPVKTSSFDHINRPVVRPTNEPMWEDLGKKNGRNFEQKGSNQGIGSALMETIDQETADSRIEGVGVSKVDEVMRQQRNKDRLSTESSKYESSTANSESSDSIRQTEDTDIEDDASDALYLVLDELTRHLAGEIEQSSSSSSSSSSASSCTSSEFIFKAPELEINSAINKCRTIENVSPAASENSPLNSSATTKIDPKNPLKDFESSQLGHTVKEPRSNTDCSQEFDLNREFSSEDVDKNQGDGFKNPASRDVVAPGMLTAPLKFEESLGCKGSASTSAFRPASPRRTSDSVRVLAGEGTSSGSRKGEEFLDIDLNGKSGDDRVVNHMSGKENQMLPVLALGKCSFELHSKQSEMLQFDLNHADEDKNAPASQWNVNGLLFGSQNCQRSPSPASSSRIQPSAGNFDLNNNPSKCHDPPNMHPFMLGSSSNSKVNPYFGRQENSEVSIFGTKNTSTFPPQTSLHFQNGRTAEPSIDANLVSGPPMGLGPAVPYPLSLCGYNGFPMAPAMSSSSAPICGPAGPIPNVSDTRVAPFTPQIICTASTVPSSYCQPSLVMNMLWATPAPNLATPLRPDVDLSSAYPIDIRSRDPAYVQQLCIPSQSEPEDNKLSDNFKPLSSEASGGKRKEPQSGFELFPTNYKHH